ncbi:hypothetical protein TSUD_362250 [Trifolium subterraneum]|uniref:(+)-neomenthol dehydrogenase n=1 Tax=Trifolium subterraneum TaxID=3900 RepID=A0A2Z6MZX5_TRISU|nr:hypothetical protein TSUD_362250 [Trifolium subterraneum]
MGEAAERIAVVTGSNKGIGFEIVKQLASARIKVVLTARDEKRGLRALETLKAFGLSDFVVFHQLDVANAASVASLADFVKFEFGKLDILVNNAGISGTVINDKGLATMLISNYKALSEDEKKKAVTQTYESLKNEWTKKVFSDVDNLTEEKVDEVLKKFLEDFKEGSLESKDWPKTGGAYVLSKAAMNAYTRIIAKNFPTLCVNSICPGYVITDITGNTGKLTAEEGAASVVKLALLPNGSPSGQFYIRTKVSSF